MCCSDSGELEQIEQIESRVFAGRARFSSLKAAATFVIRSHSHRLSSLSSMKRGAKSFRRPPISARRQEEPRMADVLEQMERSGSIYFVKTLTQTAIHIRNTERTAMLAMPAQFVRDNGDKIEEWVILRTHLWHGRSGRPWTVRLSVSEAGRVVFCGGFYAFVTDNWLNEGDSVIFVLQTNARSEFEVYTFRKSQDSLYPDEGDSTSSDEENSSRSSSPSPSHYQNERKRPFTRASSPSPSHYQNERKKPFTRSTTKARVTPSPSASHFDYPRVLKKEPTRDTIKARATPSAYASQFDYHRVHKKEPASDTREWRATASRFASQYHWQNYCEIPFFTKRLTASNIGRSDRDPRNHSGQFELPERFLRMHAKMIQNPVKLQGIYEHSRTHIIACRQRPGTRFRIDFLVTDWSRFVKENRLEKGQELQFTLMADSYFLVRKVYYLDENPSGYCT